MVITCSKGKDRPGKVANYARGRLTGKIIFSLSPWVSPRHHTFDPMLLIPPLGSPLKSHQELLSLQPMSLPKGLNSYVVG